MSVAYADTEFLAVRRRPLRQLQLDSVTEPVSFFEWQNASKPADFANWIKDVVLRFAELIQLEANWDGRGSAPVKSDVLRFADGILFGIMEPLTPAPSIIPLGNGGIQLVWANNRAELEVEISAPPHVTFFHVDRATGQETESTADTDYSEIASFLKAEFTP